MRLSLLCLASAWLLPSCLASKISQTSSRDHDRFDYYALKLDSSASPNELANHLGIEYDGQWVVSDDTHVFKAPKNDADIIRDSIDALHLHRLKKRDFSTHILDSVKYPQKQILRKRLVKRGVIPQVTEKRADASVESAIAQRSDVVKRLGIQDPIFNEQWHLINTQKPGNDLNITGVWLQGITGKGATVCIVDDGLDMDSDDLKDNYFAKGSYDFNDKGPEPRPRLDDDNHGTRCAGEVAAGRNNACGLGVAYDARISAVRILSAPIADLDEAEAVLYGYQDNDIYSCSWGPPDDGRTMDAPGLIIQKAMQKAILEGRNGKGTIYVFAAGNGAAAEDNCNFDGYTNSIFSVTIGAIDRSNRHPYYSERCSAQLAVTYSSGDGEAIHTTDVGQNRCSGSHGGTSAAGPLVAGVLALVVGIRPDLTWRDVQWLTALSAQPFYDQEPIEEWQTTATGRKYSHQYGYGNVDAYAIVELAKDWKLVKKQAWYFSPTIQVNHDIPEGDQGLSSTFEVTRDMLNKANLERVEQVTVTMNVAHSRRGDISVDLISPFGVISHLSETRKLDDAALGYVDWTFMTVAHFGETGIGTWKLVVRDTIDNAKGGQLLDWRLKIYGESIDPSKQGSLPYPDEDESKDTTPAGTIETTSLLPQPTSTIDIPSSLPTRPSIARPTDESSNGSVDASTEIPTLPTAVPSASDQIASPTPVATGDLEPGKEETGNTGSKGSDSSQFLPSPFPTFGVSKRTQIWIYGALALILLFCLSLAVYTWYQRRKRLMNDPRDNYVFEMLEDQEETDGMLGGGRNSVVGRKAAGRRRAGELYDAFAGESDTDGELFSEEEGEGNERTNIYDDFEEEEEDET